MSGFLAFLPQLFAGLIIFGFAMLFCRIIIGTWRWLGLNFFFKTPTDISNLPSVIWFKTVPLLIYLTALPFILFIVLSIWDIDGVSAPLTHGLNLLIGSPLVMIAYLLLGGLIHIFFVWRENFPKA